MCTDDIKRNENETQKKEVSVYLKADSITELKRPHFFIVAADQFKSLHHSIIIILFQIAAGAAADNLVVDMWCGALFYITAGRPLNWTGFHYIRSPIPRNRLAFLFSFFKRSLVIAPHKKSECVKFILGRDWIG